MPDLVSQMDEPTAGLQCSAIGLSRSSADRLVDGGDTVILIARHLDVILGTVRIIALGPADGVAA